MSINWSFISKIKKPTYEQNDPRRRKSLLHQVVCTTAAAADLPRETERFHPRNGPSGLWPHAESLL
jgi:hypothetical protein